MPQGLLCAGGLGLSLKTIRIWGGHPSPFKGFCLENPLKFCFFAKFCHFSPRGEGGALVRAFFAFPGFFSLKPLENGGNFFAFFFILSFFFPKLVLGNFECLLNPQKFSPYPPPFFFFFAFLGPSLIFLRRALTKKFFSPQKSLLAK